MPNSYVEMADFVIPDRRARSACDQSRLSRSRFTFSPNSSTFITTILMNSVQAYADIMEVELNTIVDFRIAI